MKSKELVREIEAAGGVFSRSSGDRHYYRLGPELICVSLGGRGTDIEGPELAKVRRKIEAGKASVAKAAAPPAPSLYPKLGDLLKKTPAFQAIQAEAPPAMVRAPQSPPSSGGSMGPIDLAASDLSMATDEELKRYMFTEVGRMISYARKLARLTPANVARRVGVSEALVVRWEAGLEIPDAERTRRLQASVPRLKGSQALERILDEVERPDRRARRGSSEIGLLGAAGLVATIAEKVAPAPITTIGSVAEEEGLEPEEVARIEARAEEGGASFGERLRAARLAENVGQDTLGELIGVTGQAVSQWERGAVAPVREHMLRCVEIFPQLEAHPQSRDIPGPTGARGHKRGSPAPAARSAQERAEVEKVLPLPPLPQSAPAQAEPPPAPAPEPLPPVPEPEVPEVTMEALASVLRVVAGINGEVSLTFTIPEDLNEGIILSGHGFSWIAPKASAAIEEALSSLRDQVDKELQEAAKLHAKRLEVARLVGLKP